MATVTVYLEDNSLESARVLDFISWIKTIDPRLDVKLVNVSRMEDSEEFENIALPAFEINGTLITGSLDREQLQMILRSLAEQNLN